MANRFIKAADGGGWGIGAVECSYIRLVELFGEPNGVGDAYKVSTSWYVEDTQTGQLLEVYDWKETNLYSPGQPTVQQFRDRAKAEWHIGGRIDAGTDAAHRACDALQAFINARS